MGIPHFYDHAGNIMNGSFGATIVTLAAGVAIELAPPEKKKAITIGAAGVAATVSSGVNVAYEAGVHIPPFAQKPDGAPFDGQDALYGSAGGLITALVFGAATVALLAKNKRQHNHGKHRK
jgi:cellobiose-specific phosphotransferase system component IIC